MDDEALSRLKRQRLTKLYWAVMLPMFARELFVDVEHRPVHLKLIEVHWRLKWHLLPFGDDPDKRVEEQVRSTSVSQMSDADFEDYIDRLTIFAGLNGIQFPKRGPDE